MKVRKIINNKNLSILIVVFVLMLSCAYSSFNSVLNVTGTIADVRIKSDIRITGLRVDSVTNGGVSASEDYNKTIVRGGGTFTK